MSIQNEITRLTGAKNTIRTKLVELKLVESSAKLDQCATAVDGIVNNGSVSSEVKEGETYTIPRGYHDGSGTVSGVAGGGNYALQSKTATPTKSKQTITPDAGKYGLSDVIVNPIPENFQDVTAVTAGAGDVLANKIIVDAEGNNVAGTMPNNGALSKSLKVTYNDDASVEDFVCESFNIPAGYTSGGKVDISIQADFPVVTPTKNEQKIVPSDGYVLGNVKVEAIPSNYIDTSDADAQAEHILEGTTAYSGGVKLEGTMPNNGNIHEVLDTTRTSFVIQEGYHNGEGEVAIVLEEKSATPSASAQTITPTSGKVLSKVTVAATPTETKTVTPTEEVQNLTPTAGKFFSKVTVNAIPEEYHNTEDAKVLSGQVLEGAVYYDADGKQTGTMANNGAVSATIDGLTTLSYAIPAGYHDGSGTVSLTSDIEELLAAI